MAPDRLPLQQQQRASTSQSFTLSAALNLPLSSHGPQHAPSLTRGMACLTCRSRKIKCDGVQPACSACRKSASAKGEDPNLVMCNFDAPEQRRKPVGGGKVAGLEAKIAALEKRIEELTFSQSVSESSSSSTPSSASAKTPPSMTDTSYIGDNFGSTDYDLFASTTDYLATRATYPNVSGGPLFSSSDPQAIMEASDFFSRSHAHGGRPLMPIPTPIILPASSELLCPGWPLTLPSPHLVTTICQTYFSKIHATTDLLNKAKFFSCLALPPTDKRFPITPLLHAIIATASGFVSEDVWQGEQRYWGPNETPSDWHLTQAKMGIESSWVNDQDHLQVAQTAVIICFASYAAARFGEVWLLCAQATRLVVPLGINHLRPKNVSNGRFVKGSQIKTSMLQPTDDPIELYERSATLWFAVLCDRIATASTGWAGSLDDDDVTTLLPSYAPYPYQDLNESPLSPHNGCFYTAHPPHLVGVLALYLKAVMLMGKTVTYLHRSPSVVGVGSNNGPLKGPFSKSQDDPDQDTRDSFAFRKLDQLISDFQMSIPREFQLFNQTHSSDSRILLIYTVPYTAIILLHEPFCTLAPDDVSMIKCSQAARAVLTSVYSIYTSSFDIGKLMPWVTFLWGTAGRTLVRELAIKQHHFQTDGVDELRSNVLVIISAMRSTRSALGGSCAMALETLLAHPSLCLPDQDVRQRAMPFDECVPPVHSTLTTPLYPRGPHVVWPNPKSMMVYKTAGGARAPIGAEEETLAREKMLRDCAGVGELEMLLMTEGADRFAEMEAVEETVGSKTASATVTALFEPLNGDGLFDTVESTSTATMAMNQDDADQLWAAFGFN